MTTKHAWTLGDLVRIIDAYDHPLEVQELLTALWDRGPDAVDWSEHAETEDPPCPGLGYERDPYRLARTRWRKVRTER